VAGTGAGVLTVVATLRAAKGKADALAAMLTEQVGVVRKAEPGCTAYRLHRSVKDPDQFYFYETYVDEAAFELHRNAPYLADYRTRREREGLLDGPVDVQVYRSLTA
jgi:quinol monooxygenase YgiN